MQWKWLNIHVPNTQAVGRCVKLATEASIAACGEDNRTCIYKIKNNRLLIQKVSIH